MRTETKSDHRAATRESAAMRVVKSPALAVAAIVPIAVRSVTILPPAWAIASYLCCAGIFLKANHRDAQNIRFGLGLQFAQERLGRETRKQTYENLEH